MKILSFGEIIWDVYPDSAVIGGAPMNFAAHCTKCGAEGYILSAVGNDKLGDDALSELSRLGVNTSLVSRNDYPTGRCNVTLDENRIPTYSLVSNVAYDHIEYSDELFEKVNGEKFDALCFGTLSQRNPVSALTLRKLLDNCDIDEIFCDVNLRPNGYSEGSVRLCFERSTTLKISDEEAPLLEAFDFIRGISFSNARDAICEIFKRYPNIKRILYTKGSAGAEVHTRDEQIIIDPVKVDAVSSVGAGDSFGASWLTAMLGGASYGDAARLAAKVSAFVVSRTEAVPEYSLIHSDISGANTIPEIISKN